MTFIGIRSGSFVVAGNSKQFLYMHSFLILIILAWSLYLFIIKRTVDLSNFRFSELPIQFSASPEAFSTIFIWLNNSY